jgi:lipopolysaccharide transport system permease protein
VVDTAAPDPNLNDVSSAANRVTVIEQKSSWAIFDLREVWQYRDLLMALANRDVKLRYRQTALGFIWVLLQPLMGAGVITLLFSGFGSMTSGEIPFFVFSFAGMIGWTAFSQTVSKASNSLLTNSQLVSKVYFPRLTLPISTIFSTMLDLVVSATVLAVLLVVAHVVPSIYCLLAPLWLVPIFLLAMGIGLFTGALMVSYRDVNPIQQMVLQYGTFAVPAGYSLLQIIEKFPKLYWFFQLNPLSHLLEGLRWSIFGSTNGVAVPAIWGVVYALIFSMMTFVAGLAYFGKMERRFADVI